MKKNPEQSQESSNLSDISNVAEKFLENSEILKLKEQIQKKDEEITHLKQLLMSYSPLVGQAESIVLTNEEIIAVKQIERLNKASLDRELTLDEAKRLDIYVKILRLVRGQSTTINGDKKDLPKDLSPGKLIEIASRKIIEE